MGDYVVGSIADIISNKYSPNVKSKKGKLKLNNGHSSQSSSTNCEDPIPTSNITKTKKKKKNKDALNEFSTQSFPAETECNDVTEKSTKSVTPQVQTKSKPKKRKQLNTAEGREKLKHKRPKTDLFDDNCMPSDSENDEENVGKHSKENKKLSKNLIEKKNLNENTVFIGNIPINYDKQKICKAFSKFGEIQNARIRCVPIADFNMTKKVAAIKKKFNPKRNSLVAYVNFKSLDSAKAAVNANGMIIDGHHLRVDFANNSKEKDNNKAIFVGGLPFDIEDDELWEFFQNCGKINSVRVIRDSQTSMGKGFGYVNFDSTTSVELALQLNGQELKKRVINVKRCINAKKKKFNGFGKKESKEMANQLLCKRGKKFKEEKKLKKENKNSSSDFQGRKANMKEKKKKKLSKAALRQKKLIKILAAS